MESAALVVDMARRVESKAQNQNRQSQICRSLTSFKSPPKAAANSARPTQNMHPPVFVIFKKKKIASAEPAEKKIGTTHLDANLQQKCKLQAAYFMLFMLRFIFCITCFQNYCFWSTGEHIFAKRLQAILIK